MHSSNLPSETLTTYDIPKGWWNDREEFRERVLKLVREIPTGSKAPKYEIRNADGSITPFYPVLTAVSPEWGIVTEDELREILREKLREAAHHARERSKTRYADHVWWAMYLAWGIQQNLFTDEELAEIRFDHGETPKTYAELHSGGKDCLEETLTGLVHPYSDLEEVRWKAAMAALAAMDACDGDCMGH